MTRPAAPTQNGTGPMFERNEKVLFRHCDPAGIVFFPRYFEMMNDHVEAFFADALDWPFETLLADGGVPTRAISTGFLAASRHGDVLTLRLAIVRIGTTSLTYRLTAHAGEELRFETEATLVHIDGQARPTPWPEAIRERLQTWKETT